jgi:hypothetical protein
LLRCARHFAPNDQAAEQGVEADEQPLLDARWLLDAVFNTYWLMTQRVSVLAVILALAVDPQRASACSCASWPVREWYEKAQMVFVGELVSAAPHPTDRCGDETLTFIASEVFKGGKPGPIILEHGPVGRHKDGSRHFSMSSAEGPTNLKKMRALAKSLAR